MCWLSIRIWLHQVLTVNFRAIAASTPKRILDGRYRWRACERLGIRADERVIDPPGGGIAYVVSKNLQRRHLTEPQRAMIAADMAKLLHGERKAEARMQASVTQREAAKLIDVARSSVQLARQIQEKAAPDVAAAVRTGQLSLRAATETFKPRPLKTKAQLEADALAAKLDLNRCRSAFGLGGTGSAPGRAPDGYREPSSR
jgi:hypothetical protein